MFYIYISIIVEISLDFFVESRTSTCFLFNIKNMIENIVSSTTKNVMTQNVQHKLIEK